MLFEDIYLQENKILHCQLVLFLYMMPHKHKHNVLYHTKKDDKMFAFIEFAPKPRKSTSLFSMQK